VSPEMVTRGLKGFVYSYHVVEMQNAVFRV
jgi:hypothetical protein